jgi:WD40 repeat protein
MLALWCVALSATEPARVCAQEQAPKPATPQLDHHGDSLPPGAIARLGTVRLRHAGAVRSIALTGDQLVSVGAEGWTKRWDVNTGKLLSSFRSTVAEVPAGFNDSRAVVSDDGRLVATIADPGLNAERLVVWDTSTGKLTADIRDKALVSQLGKSLFISPDGKFLAANDRLYDATTGREVRRLAWNDQPANIVAFSRDGKHVAGVSMTAANVVGVWDTAQGALRETIKVSDTRFAPSAVALAPDGKTLAAVTDRAEVHLWDVSTGKQRRALIIATPERPLIGFLEYSPDGNTIAVGDRYNNLLFLWNAATGKLVHQIAAADEPLCAAFSADGKILAIGHEDRWIRIWDVATGKEKKPFGAPNVAGAPLALSSNGKTLATRGDAGSVQLWSYPEGKRLRDFGRGRDPNCLALSPTGTLLVTGDADGHLRFFDVVSGNETRDFLAHSSQNDDQVEANSVLSVAFSPDGKLIASGGCDCRVRVWDAKTGKAVRASPSQSVFMFGVAFSPDGKLVAGGGCGSDGAKTVLWDAMSGERLRTLEVPATAFAFSRTGDEIVAAGGLFGLWGVCFVDARTGNPLPGFAYTKGGAMDHFHAAAVSPDGRTAALGSERGITLCDMATRKVVRRISGEFGACMGLTFAPDGRTLIAGHADRTVLFWDVSDRVGRQKRR